MDSLGSAVSSLRSGEVIAYPTEGVWGLGCDPFNEEAISKLLNLKGRSESKCLILIGSNLKQFSDCLNQFWFAQNCPNQNLEPQKCSK